MKKTTGFITLITVLACLAGNAYPAPAAEKPGGQGDRTAPYTFAVVPYYTPEKIWTLFSPFVDHLGKATGHPWKLQLYHDHDIFVEDLCNGKISVALAGPVPAGRAFNRCGIRPILVALSRDGKPSYRSVVVTSNESIRDLSGLKGRKFGLFKGSTAAHILPVKMLKDAGVNLADLQPVFLESQDRIISGLLSGELTAGGMKEVLYRKAGDKKLRVLATSEALPNFALYALPSFPVHARERLTSSLLSLKPLSSRKDAETVKTWDDEVRNGFAPPGDDFLPSILNLYSIYWNVTNDPR